MTGRTHLTVGMACGVAIALTTHQTNPQIIASMALVGLLGGALPDIDHPQSTLSGWIPGSGVLLWLSGIRHRTFTHSAIFTIFVGILAMWACIHFKLQFEIAFAFIAGYSSHLVCDALTPMGIPLFYPLPITMRLLPRFLSPIMGLLDFVVWCMALLVIAGSLIKIGGF